MISPSYSLASLVQRLVAIVLGQNGAVATTTITAASGSTAATVASGTGIVPGMVVIIPTSDYAAGTYVISVAGTALVLSSPALLAVTAVSASFAQGFSEALNGQKVKLFTNSPSLSTKMTIASFTEAAFDQYAAITLAMVASYIQGGVLPIGQSQLLRWTMTSAVTPQTVNGYWVDDGVNVIMAAYFDSPVAMAQVGAELSGVLQDSYPPGAGFVQVSP